MSGHDTSTEVLKAVRGRLQELLETVTRALDSGEPLVPPAFHRRRILVPPLPGILRQGDTVRLRLRREGVFATNEHGADVWTIRAHGFPIGYAAAVLDQFRASSAELLGVVVGGPQSIVSTAWSGTLRQHPILAETGWGWFVREEGEPIRITRWPVAWEISADGLGYSVMPSPCGHAEQPLSEPLHPGLFTRPLAVTNLNYAGLVHRTDAAPFWQYVEGMPEKE